MGWGRRRWEEVGGPVDLLIVMARSSPVIATSVQR